MDSKIRLFNSNGVEIRLETMVFSGGEVKVRIHGPKNESVLGPARIEALLFNSTDIMTLVMLVNACRNHGYASLRLTMPYIPYARQDRVCNEGEAFSLKVFADIINGLNFVSVTAYDPHSNVAHDLIFRLLPVPSYELIRCHTDVHEWIRSSIWSCVPTYLVCPDKGAIDRTNAITERFSFHGVIYADKSRRPEDGKIMGIALSNPEDATKIKGAKLLIVDDICDGGRTFLELAKVLKSHEPLEMNLYVTHGIFSQGKHVLQTPRTPDKEYTLTHLGKPNNTGPFDNVWCTIDFTNYV